MPLLDVQHLSLEYRLQNAAVRAVEDVSFTIDHGETLGLVGESGCGKSSVAFSLMRVVPPGTRLSGQVLLDGEDLFTLDEAAMRQRRWKQIAMVFQAAMNALNPVFRVSDQVAEPLLKHERVSKRAARARVAEIFDLVGLPRARLDAYPHELSGGMKQRAVIAMSLICRPQVLIADEPTTALDVVVQDQILGMLKELQDELGFALLIISHDISMIAQTCDRVAVMYGGRIMEVSPTRDLFEQPEHPYTHALLDAYPTVDGPRRYLIGLPGQPPDLSDPPPGCRFAPRCPLAEEICVVTEPGLRALEATHASRCHFAGEVGTRLAGRREEVALGG
jgi:oligopeptide/dipeptide ABC transporter ATP-binding protein